MEIQCQQKNNEIWYNWQTIQNHISTAEPCALQLRFDQYPNNIVLDEEWMTKKTIQPFLRWFADQCSYKQRPIVQAILNSMHTKRSLSKKHRWEIAWAQQYKCNICKQLLHPKAMDIDHIIELAQGGEDTVQNCQALCSNCHAKKTRGANIFSSYFQ